MNIETLHKRLTVIEMAITVLAVQTKTVKPIADTIDMLRKEVSLDAEASAAIDPSAFRLGELLLQLGSQP